MNLVFSCILFPDCPDYLVIIDAVYSSYVVSRERLAFFWPLSVLRTACSLAVYVFFLPILELFASINNCVEK